MPNFWEINHAFPLHMGHIYLILSGNGVYQTLLVARLTFCIPIHFFIAKKFSDLSKNAIEVGFIWRDMTMNVLLCLHISGKDY